MNTSHYAVARRRSARGLVGSAAVAVALGGCKGDDFSSRSAQGGDGGIAGTAGEPRSGEGPGDSSRHFSGGHGGLGIAGVLDGAGNGGSASGEGGSPRGGSAGETAPQTGAAGGSHAGASQGATAGQLDGGSSAGGEWAGGSSSDGSAESGGSGTPSGAQGGIGRGGASQGGSDYVGGTAGGGAGGITASNGGTGASGDPAAGGAIEAAGTDETTGGGGAAGTSGAAGTGGAAVCDGCRIDGRCVQDGAVNEGNSCLSCNVSLATGRWSNRDGAACDDGRFCTGSDSCQRGVCSGSAAVDPCLPDDSCNPMTDQCCAASTTRVCGTDGNVHTVDSCGQDLGITETCSADNGDCANGNCVCVPGWGGEDCSRCIRFVHPEGSDAGPGTSWTNAYRRLDSALRSSDCDLWIARGEYAPGSLREDTFAIAAGRRIYGGFQRNQTNLEERDFAANPSVLTGEIGTTGDLADNSHHVVTLGDGALLDGFTVTRGDANGDAVESSGSAMLVSGVATVRNCRIVDNAGTAVFGAAGLIVEDCSFEANETALRVEGASSILRSTFTANTTGVDGSGNTGAEAVTNVLGCAFVENGTGIHRYRMPLSVEDSVFDENSTGVISDRGTMTISNSTFSANVTGAVARNDTVVAVYESLFVDHTDAALRAGSNAASWRVEGSTFEGNSIGIVGGENRVIVNGAEFIGNTGACLIGNSGMVSNSVFYGNEAPVLDLGSDDRWRLTSSTFVGNAPEQSGSVATTGGAVMVTVLASILWNNGPTPFDGNVTMEYNAIEGDLGALGTNIDLDPQFASMDPSSPDFLRLLRGSPCIDRAPDDESIPALDILGRERYDDEMAPNYNGTSTDLGAYEWVPE